MMHRLKRVVARDWPRFLIELVIVVSGISISFAFQDWREATRARSEEHRLLRTIESDLQVDQRYLKTYLEMLERGHEQLGSLLTKNGLEGKELDVAMDQAISYADFKPMTVGWKELEQTGASGLIRDKLILGELIILHGQCYAACAEWGRINRDFVLQRMIPYIDEHGPFVEASFESGVTGGMGVIHQALFEQVQFRNLIRTNRLFRQGQQAVYGVAVEKLEAIQKLLQKALRSPP